MSNSFGFGHSHRGDSTGNSPEPSRTALPARVPHVLFRDRMHPWATTRHSAVHMMTQSHCFWLGQNLDIFLKASDQNNRRASVALKKCSLHICNWDLLIHKLNPCYKERNKLWPKGSSLGILQGHRLNTASQAALQDLFCMNYCSPSEKIKLGSKLKCQDNYYTENGTFEETYSAAGIWTRNAYSFMSQDTQDDPTPADTAATVILMTSSLFFTPV